MFVGDLRPTSQHFVTTIGGTKNSAMGAGTVCWRWKDDLGHTYSEDIENVLYFPNSLVNILSVTTFAAQLKDDDGTGVDTKRQSTHFYWDGDCHQHTIYHSGSHLPELPVNEGFSLASLY